MRTTRNLNNKQAFAAVEIVNRQHPEVIKYENGLYNAFVSFPNAREIYFSNAAAIEFDMEAGKYLHFVILNGFLYFYTNADPTGFRLSADGKISSKALKAINRAALKLLREKFPVIKLGSRFTLQKTNAKQNDSLLTEILIYKYNKKTS